MSQKKIKFTHPALIDDFDGEKIVFFVPSNRSICHPCNGYGNHFRSDLDESKLVEGMEEDGDFEGLENYNNGGFDEICGNCNGQKVVDEIDWLWFEKTHPKEFSKIQNYNEMVRQEEKYALQERRFCGGY
jgi:hypothetical protein